MTMIELHHVQHLNLDTPIENWSMIDMSIEEQFSENLYADSDLTHWFTRKQPILAYTFFGNEVSTHGRLLVSILAYKLPIKPCIDCK